MSTTPKNTHSISELNKSNIYLDPNSIVEITRTNNSVSKSYRASLKQIGEGIINNVSLYKNLNSIFDSQDYPTDNYFQKLTEFSKDPKIHKENNTSTDISVSLYDELDEHNLVTKKAINEYLKNVGIGAPYCTPTATYVYYSPYQKKWIADNEMIPKVMSFTKDGIWTSKSNLKFNYGNTLYSFTDDVVANKNMMLDIVGNIVLDKNYEDTWYESGQCSFVAVSVNGHIITLSFLKNILHLKLESGKEYTIGQFHMHCPIANGTTFKIITNAECVLFGIENDDQLSRQLYDSLNAVNLSYYDYKES